ncbi:Stk1 family PASTA domain-containing Ser/Thr kinase [Fodinicola acaciae]|uniref:Stk1 family PASTA domain-containing Ser/Thr kinase n=1 Tax=Fodinicola acaciae TaxID=2681555 RepID=UPI0013D057F4|nr:Stk1 family PASTA domain-containing Ser/Thr kinase [Fodinicola acaciae]
MNKTATDPLVGAVLEDRYRIRGMIARGGMATVYHALDERLERTVAIKVIHPAYATDPSFVDRFTREARSIARLSHPNVVAVYDQGSHNGLAFLVMEYVPGRTLRHLLTERGRLAPEEAVGVLGPLLSALAAAHRIGMVHRDVKPENVLLSTDGTVKVADFGLARIAESSRATATKGVMFGTVAYVAPEIVTVGSADPRADVYAAGIVLFEMLTGQPPYRGETPVAVAYQHVHSEMPVPSERAQGVPYALDDLVLHATMREPGARPPDAGAMLAELRDVVSDLGMTAMPPAIEPPAPQWEMPTEAVPKATLLSGPQPPAQTQGANHPSNHPNQPGRAVVPPPQQHDVDVDDLPYDEGPPSRLATLVNAIPPQHRRYVVIAVIAVLAILVGTMAWWLGAGRYVEAPRVVGLTKAAAEAKLTQAGLHAGYDTPAFDEKVPKGSVVSQDPSGGGDVVGGGTVTLVLSKGPERYAVPDVVNQPQAAALNTLRGSHLSPQTTEAYDDKIPAGNVVSTDPAAGTQVKRDAVIKVVVSKGAQPVQLPNLVGQGQSRASDTLSGLGLKVSVKREFSDTVPAGTVLAQDPGPSTVGKGSTVTLTVSKGPNVVTVPDLRGQTADAASAKLRGLGLNPQVQTLPGGQGQVFNQNPPPNSKVALGSTVTLYVF